MTSAHVSAALRAPAHRMAKAGYGKRLVPDEAPRGAADFAHLLTREAAIAAYIDRLPEGAAIGYKVLAEELPDYGQQACRSALDRLTRAGHLRRIRVQIAVEGSGLRWVTRTFFARTARDAAWWTRYIRYIRGVDAPGQPPAPDTVRSAEPEPGVPAARSEAYSVLAGLGGREPRLQLSEGECVALEPLVQEWLARGVGREQVGQVLVAGLAGFRAFRRSLPPYPTGEQDAARTAAEEEQVPGSGRDHRGGAGDVRLLRRGREHHHARGRGLRGLPRGHRPGRGERGDGRHPGHVPGPSPAAYGRRGQGGRAAGCCGAPGRTRAEGGRLNAARRGCHPEHSSGREALVVPCQVRLVTKWVS